MILRAFALLGVMLFVEPASAQPIDLSSGGPIAITARDGIEWRQDERQVVARGDARAVRENVTVTADWLTAWYRKKADGAVPAPASVPSGAPRTPDTDTGGSEIYRLQADGNVVISTPTDRAVGDRATYDIDRAVLVMTGRNLKLTTPSQVLTARDTLEYWSQKRMAVARGNAVVLTNDARRLAADTLVAYMKPAPAGTKPPGGDPGAAPGAAPVGGPGAATGALEKIEAFGNVSVRTQTDIVTGDRGVYAPETGIARLGGTVRITRGQNQLNGTEAEVNLKTGVSRLLAGGAGRVQGLVVPNDRNTEQLDPAQPLAPPAGSR